MSPNSQAHFGDKNNATGQSWINFPVFFPVSREYGLETGSRWTASPANVSFMNAVTSVAASLN